MREHYVQDTLYADPGDWDDGDAYALYRFMTHALAKAGRYEWYAGALASLDFEKASPEACAIARAALAEIPGGEARLSETSLAAIRRAPVPHSPVRLSPTADESSPLAEYGVLL